MFPFSSSSPLYSPHVLSTATDKEIRKAYKTLVRQWHPDKTDHPDAEQRFLDIVEAYQVLSDPELRAVYDEGRDISDFMERRRKKQQQQQSADGDAGAGADEKGSSNEGSEGQQPAFDDAVRSHWNMRVASDGPFSQLAVSVIACSTYGDILLWTGVRFLMALSVTI